MCRVCSAECDVDCRRADLLVDARCADPRCACPPSRPPALPPARALSSLRPLRTTALTRSLWGPVRDHLCMYSP
jgi:hypothetical protein